MRRVVVESLEKFAQQVTVREHTFVTDEPPDEGGDDRGPTPYDFLLSALGGCTAITLLMYTKRKGWPVESLRVEVTHERVRCGDLGDCDEEPDRLIDVFTVDTQVRGDLTEEQRRRMQTIAGMCPVHKALTGKPRINETLRLV
ncbi:MAG: OsmC family protein [SAR202 cluster bacterium]|nr:OsmC family protein [SAR202 cluster bacterium]